MPWLGASGAELTLNLCEYGVEEGHFRRRMAQQFHECLEHWAVFNATRQELLLRVPHLASVRDAHFLSNGQELVNAVTNPLQGSPGIADRWFRHCRQRCMSLFKASRTTCRIGRR